MKKNCKKQIRKSFELKGEQREKAKYYIVNRKATIVVLIVGLIKKT